MDTSEELRLLKMAVRLRKRIVKLEQENEELRRSRDYYKNLQALRAAEENGTIPVGGTVVSFG